MGASAPLTPDRIHELVLENHVIRAPYYESDYNEDVSFTDPERGLQWGADVIPALLGVYRVERDPRTEDPARWICFARHWRGQIVRLAVTLFEDAAVSSSILVVNEIAAGENAVAELESEPGKQSADPPEEQDWQDRSNRYQRVRRDDDTDGTAAVLAYIGALPGWKQTVASQFDALVQNEVPAVRRAVRYHQPFYGRVDAGWFASFSAFSKHVKLSFVCESYLDPEPPSGTGPERQALDLTASDDFDETRIASWIRQAASEPGMNW